DSYNPFAASKLTEIMKSERPDLIHTNNLAGFSVSIWNSARRLHIPVVHTIRDHYLLCPNSTMYKNDKNCLKQCSSCRILAVPRKKQSSVVQAVVGVSRFILKKHEKFGYFPKAQIRAQIYNPSDINLTPASSNSTDGRIQFGLIGMLAPIKGTEYFIKRFASMKTDQAILKIFGRGITDSYEKMLIERYKSDNIEFMGYRKPEEIYREIDVAVIPSLCDDAFPRVVIEAYSHGMPIIATSMGGASEMIDTGRTGFIFDPAVQGDLEEKMGKFISDPGLAQVLSPACLEKAKNFEIDNVVGQYIDIYTRVTG
ncbi:MAG: glycosyltransferase, partial [Candidatus Zixiibacteriota bacterium]